MQMMIKIGRTKTSEPMSTSPTDDTSADNTGKESLTDSTADAETNDSDAAAAADDDDDDDVDDDEETQEHCHELMTSQTLRPLRLELTPESQLDSVEPICVDLLDCTVSVMEVLKWLTSASWSVCVGFCLSVFTFGTSLTALYVV